MLAKLLAVLVESEYASVCAGVLLAAAAAPRVQKLFWKHTTTVHTITARMLNP